METATSTFRARPGKYLVFALSGEAYGVNIFQVREIIAIPAITPVPRTPIFIKGVINLRGKIIPVVDLRAKFSMRQEEKTRDTCVVIVDAPSADGRILMGVIVDAVREVVDFNAASLEEVPSFGIRVDTSFLLGLGRQKDSVTLLLDIDKVLSHEELIEVKNVKSSSEQPAELSSFGMPKIQSPNVSIDSQDPAQPEGSV